MRKFTTNSQVFQERIDQIEGMKEAGAVDKKRVEANCLDETYMQMPHSEVWSTSTVESVRSWEFIGTYSQTS